MVFQKRNPKTGSRSLECEVRGLEELRRFQSKHGLNIPKVIQVTSSTLTLERIDLVTPRIKDWVNLGQGLAALHRVKGEAFGFSEDNFIGLNEQRNRLNKDWGEFFADQRLKVQVQWVKDSQCRERWLEILDRQWSKLKNFLNDHQPQPSLVHGDLWSGNVLFDSKGPWLIDPAVYYGDRETDLAMTRMFGGFHSEFYRSYMKEWPLPPGHEQRQPIYNLYHYLNHYNLFGEGYLSGVEEGFRLIAAL